ncbi:MAG: adenosylmethionine--8-amino-7-oxononanoate transaminase [Actinobacteria bacterium]|nr:adenosylmethionine--8-amino-7-oxononanoate transaminase [Actinomycetota bacterium]
MRATLPGRVAPGPLTDDGPVTTRQPRSARDLSLDELGADPQLLLTWDRDHVWHPYASMTRPGPALPVVSASGVRLRLADGTELIDATSSWWTAIHGYRHPVLDAALAAQAARLPHVMFGGLTHAPAVKLARLLVEITPEPLRHVFFADSGSVAVEVAIKMALQYWQSRGRPAKSRLLTVLGGYHGDTFAAMSVCDPVNGMHQLFSRVLPRQVFAPRPPAGFEAPLDEAYLAELTRLVEAHRDELAAVILEPVVQNAGGMNVYHPGYLRRLRELCDEHGVLLIADEIATGFGRTGELFACGHADVAPDILCVGKAMTAGYLTLAATLCTAEVAEGICAAEPGLLMHGPTYMANALAAAVGVASVELLLDGPWRRRVADLDRWLRAGLAPAAALPGVADVRVLGAIGVLETHAPVDVTAVQRVAIEHGVWLRPFGRLIYTMPPYVLDEAGTAAVTGAMVAAAHTLPAPPG